MSDIVVQYSNGDEGGFHLLARFRLLLISNQPIEKRIDEGYSVIIVGTMGHLFCLNSSALLIAGIDPEILKVVGQFAGIGGIAIGALIIIFRDIIRKNIFPSLVKREAYRLLILIVILVWSVAIAGIVAWVLVHNRDAGTIQSDGTRNLVSKESQPPSAIRDAGDNGSVGTHDVEVMDQAPAIKVGFKKSQLTFYVTVTNSSKDSIVIESLGVQSKVSYGRFDCRSESGPLFPGGSYVVPFRINRVETIKQLRVPVKVIAGDAIRLEVFLNPDTSWLCNKEWGTYVSLFGVLLDKKRIYSLERPRLITNTDLDSYEEQQPEDEAIKKQLRNADSNIRISAIWKIPNSTIPREQEETLLEGKLEDPVEEVRAAAASVTGNMNFTSLAEAITSQLRSSRSGAREKAVYAEALGKLRVPVSVDALVAYLTDLTKGSTVVAKNSLLALKHPLVPEKVRQLLVKRHWSTEGTPDRVREINDAICEILVRYEDMDSVPNLRELISKARISDSCFATIRKLIPDEGIMVQDQFILSLEPAIERAALSSPAPASHREMIKILCRIASGGTHLEKVIENGLSDPDSSVRIEAANCAASHGYSTYANRIATLYDSSTSSYERAEYCEALTKLNVPCK